MAKAARKAPQAVQCDGKMRFHFKQYAKLALRRTRSRRRPLTVYRCPHCGFWHIGGEGPK